MTSLAKRLLKTLTKQFFKSVQKEKEGPQLIEPSHAPKHDGLRATSVPTLLEEKSHPWRLCPIGESWVRGHPLTVPASSMGPEHQTLRHGHCRKNKGGREIYSADELRELASTHFQGIANDANAMPVPDLLGFPNGNEYDLQIAGWTKFWNETLEPSVPLSPDLVKALIATETGFELKDDPKNSGAKLDTPSNAGPARGLIQITEKTRMILGDPNSELKQHLIEMTAEESREPIVNIAAGIRWLHYKKKLANIHLKREATWEEAIEEYKGISKQKDGKRPRRIAEEIVKFYSQLKNIRTKYSK